MQSKIFQWLVAGFAAAAAPYFAWTAMDGDGDARLVQRSAAAPSSTPMIFATSLPATVSAADAAAPSAPLDSTGRLRATRSVDEALDLMDEDIGPGGRPIDRAAMAAMLRSDPELARALEQAATAPEVP